MELYLDIQEGRKPNSLRKKMQNTNQEGLMEKLFKWAEKHFKVKEVKYLSGVKKCFKHS